MARSFSRSFVRLGSVVLLLPAALSWAGTAAACGGFFCSASAPVNQAAERILFAQDGETTTQIVEILYDGPSERFAWVLPVPGVPELAVSSSVVFQRLQQATNPTYTLTTTMPDDCDGLTLARSGRASGAELLALGDQSSVTVVDQGSVGPFDHVTISIDPQDDDPAEVAIRWLTTNGYDVDAAGGNVLRPYLDAGLNLLAIRLQKGLPSGAIRPLSLTFTGNQPSIPIRPTAVAANDDMGVLVWVLGESRAVPTNYKGLQLNELLIDWTNPGNTYDQVVTAAADEAGGQGFVTELAEPSARFQDVIASGIPHLNGADYTGGNVGHALARLTSEFGAFDGFDKVVAENVTFRQGVTAADWIQCSDCYINSGSYDSVEDPINRTNIPVFVDAVQSQVLQPVLDAADLFKSHQYVTRLYTTMSAGDMDTDPVFDFNPDLPDVSNVHTAERLTTCDGVGGKWRVTLPDGREVYGSGFSWPFSTATATLPINAQIVSFKTTGAPTVETDNREMIASNFAALEASQPNGVGEGVFSCSVATPERRSMPSPFVPSPLVLALGAAGVAARVRRRRG